MSDIAPPQTTGSIAGDLQFERAQFTDAAAAALTCGYCQQALTFTYFQVNDQPACAACRTKAEHEMAGRPGPAGMMKAIAAGGGAAFAGALLYYAVVKLTGYEFGLIAIVVGFMVGYAVRWGSGGWGGPLYQTIAVGLTYLSIVGSYAPFMIEGLQQASSQQAAATETSASAVGNSTPPTDARAASTEAETGEPITAAGVAMALGLLFALLLISPFLGGMQSILGLLIIGFGLFEAWKLNKRRVLQIAGPFQVGRAAADVSPAS